MPKELGEKPENEDVDKTETEGAQGSESKTEEPFDKDRAMKTIRRQREELRDMEKSLKTLKQDKADREAEELSEADRLKKQNAALEARVAELETQGKEAAVRTAIIAAAAKAGFNDPNDAVSMVDRKALKVGDDEIEGLDDALKALAKDKPYLLKAQQEQPQQQGKTQNKTMPSAGNPANSGKISLDDVRNMTPEEINRNWDKIKGVLKEG